MKRLTRFLIVTAALFVVAFFFIFSVDLKSLMIFFFSSVLLVGYITYKDKVGQELIIAFLFAFALTAYFVYEYTTPNLMFGRINLFPLISWTFGLVLLREIYERVNRKNRFLIVSLLYLALLFLVEYAGYYLLGFRLNSSFPSLLNIGVIHAPLGIKIFYVFAGPVYLLITDYLKVK